MPLKLIPPRAGKSPNYTIRGTYLNVRVNRTSGSAAKEVAAKELAKVKRDIERGRYDAGEKRTTFAGAALSYIRGGGDRTYVGRLTDHFEDTPLAEIDQDAIDEAADEICPDTTPANRNRAVYTPVSAILKRAGYDFRIKRPKGAEGKVSTDWIWPEQAAALLAAADDAEFRVFLTTLLYTGLRLSEALRIEVGDLRLQDAFAYAGTTKNGDPRPVHLPPVLVAALAGHPRGLDRGGRLFRFGKNGALYNLLKAANKKAGLSKRVRFHMLRHTWATWMRRYGGLDVKALTETGAWKDPKSAARYAHVLASEETLKADLLPDVTKGRNRS